VLDRQLLTIAETMTKVLRSPPLAGQNVSEWAKQQACKRIAMETTVLEDTDLDRFLIARSDSRAPTGRRGTTSESLKDLPMSTPSSLLEQSPGARFTPSREPNASYPPTMSAP